MADIVTRRELEDAKIDARDLGEAVNEKVIVSPRYGGDFKSLPLLSDEAQSSINGWDEAIRLITQEEGVPALAVSDASGRTQQEINNRVMYFSNYITNMDGITSNNSQFVTALTQANGREIHLEKGNIVRLTSELNLAALNVNIVGEGKIIIDHTGTGFITTGHVRIYGNIEFDGLNKSWSAFWANGGTSKRLVIGENIVFKNFYSVTQTQVVRSSCGVNIADGWNFENIRVLGNGTAGDANGAVRAFYIHGPQSFSKIKNGKVNGLNTVTAGGAIIQEDADAIQFATGVHVVETESIDFQNVGKRWLKLQGTAGSKCTVKNYTGTSAFTGTTDTSAAENNGMYAPISVYAGDLEVDGLTMSAGVCFAAVTMGTNLVGKVDLNNITYTPEYHDYVDKTDTRFVLVELNTPNARLTVGQGCYSNETRQGVDVLSEIPYLNVNSSNIHTRRTGVIQRARELHAYDNQFVKTGVDSGLGSGININALTEIVYIKNNSCLGSFQDGVTIVGGRDKELRGVVSGNIANEVTRNVVQNNETNFSKLLTIGANFGSGNINASTLATTHSFRNKAGDIQAILSDSGLNFAFESTTTSALSNAASNTNTVNKQTRKPMFDVTTNKLMIATGPSATSAWVSVDGATTITPS